jgi:hypothetical protein
LFFVAYKWWWFARFSDWQSLDSSSKLLFLWKPNESKLLHRVCLTTAILLLNPSHPSGLVQWVGWFPHKTDRQNLEVAGFLRLGGCPEGGGLKERERERERCLLNSCKSWQSSLTHLFSYFLLWQSNHIWSFHWVHAMRIRLQGKQCTCDSPSNARAALSKRRLEGRSLPISTLFWERRVLRVFFPLGCCDHSYTEHCVVITTT